MTEIVLVHGAWHGPWCWDRLAGRLTAQGHRVHKVLLRGHNQPTPIWYRIGDYVDDVTAVASRLPARPVLVGHSLGGLVVERYLDQHEVTGAVLLAPIPRRGGAPAVARLTARHPRVMARVQLSMRLRPLVESLDLVRELFFTATTPQALVEETAARLTDESYLALLEALLPRARPSHRAPVLVIGAERDGFFTPAEIAQTAAAYGTRPEIVPGAGHDLMLDVCWPQVADRKEHWIEVVVARLDGPRVGRTQQRARHADDSSQGMIKSGEIPPSRPCSSYSSRGSSTQR